MLILAPKVKLTCTLFSYGISTIHGIMLRYLFSDVVSGKIVTAIPAHTLRVSFEVSL